MKPITIAIIVVLVIAMIGVLRWYSIPKVIRTDLALQGLSNRYYDLQVNSTDSIIHEGYLYRGLLAPIQTLTSETITELLESYDREDTRLPDGCTIYLVNSSGELIKKITTANST
ncbi:MAG: hypothetical protein KF905_05510 [Flavobacteriales bacterium]|nr:hypothetical protein [Flavobacteriales bacterium]